MKKNKKIFKLNRLLSNNISLAVTCILISFLLFSIVNYIIVSLPKILVLLQGEKVDFSIATAFDYSKIIEYSIAYIILFVLIVIFNLRYIYLVKISYKEYNVGQKGSARFTTLKEIKEQYKRIPSNKNTFVGKGGFPVCMYEEKSKQDGISQKELFTFIDDTPVNNLIIGITRSGKGQMFVLPMIDIYSRAIDQSSMVITDPKLELYASSKETLEDRGYEVHLLNLVEPLKSARYNPLQLIIDMYQKGEKDSAELLINSLASTIFSSDNGGDENSQFFANTCIALLSALILAVIEENIKTLDKVNMLTIIEKFTELSSKQIDTNTNGLDEYFDELPTNNKARLKYAVVRMASSKTKGNTYTNFMSKLQIFTLSEISKMTSANNLNLHSIGFGEKPIAVFIGVPDYDTSNHYLASVFISQLYFKLAKEASLNKSGKTDREVIYILDEFGNLPAIDNMDNIITVCLGRNIKFNLIVQNYAQIEKIYGKNGAETIKSNCGNHAYIQTNSIETAELFSKLIGSETITNVNRSGKRLETGKNITEMYEAKPLLDSNQLMELKNGEWVLKRVMYRKDLNNNDITPHAIFNTGKTKSKFAYEYLSEEFPNKSISEIDIPVIKDETKSLSEELAKLKIATSIDGASFEEIQKLISSAYELEMIDETTKNELLELLEVEICPK